MINISQKMKDLLNQEVMTMATCWKMTLKNGKILGFTDLDEDIFFENITYQAKTGFSASAIENSTNLVGDTFQVESVIDSDIITQEDILKGLLDFAKIEIFLVNYLNLDAGKIHLKSGNVGKIQIYNSRFICQILGIKEKLNWQIGELYSALCRRNLGDKKCKVDINSYKAEVFISHIINEKSFKCDDLYKFNNHFFTKGFLLFENDTQKYEISDFKNGVVNITKTPSFIIEPNLKITLFAGCNKKFITCCEKFNNSLNFRGEPHIPSNISL